MGDNAVAAMQFLKEFTAEKISPTSDDDVQIRCAIVGNYSLKPEEIDGEVTDWVLNYLEHRKCPHGLAVALAKKVAQQVSTNVCKRLLQSNGENIGDEDSMLQNASSLHSEAINLLRELCNEMQNHPDQIETSGAEPLHFTSSVFAIKNGRRKMEDRHVILHDLNVVCNLENAPKHSYYAVFDGHAGVETASFACAHLHTNIVQHPSFLKDTKTAIVEAFKLTDSQFAERASRENLKSGATAVCALIRESTLYIAWVGDSQALLVKQGKPHAVMNPHKPEREDERNRIEALGGYIYHHGTWRVNGTLAVSRALGDAEHKPFVSSEPEVNIITLDGTEDFLVIACDGLWDKMSPSDVSVGSYRHLVDNPQDADGIAAKLVHQAKLMGSNDNITTIVVFLRDLPSIIADSPKYASIFPQLEGINVSSVSQIANGTAGKNYFEKESLPCEISNEVAENKYQRPTYFHKDLDFTSLDPSDWSPDSRGIHEIPDRNGKYGVAQGMPPEQTSLSELPTPPIDEVVASKQFSEYSTSEQLKIFQEHLESQGFHDVSLDEIQTSMSENLQFLSSEMQDDMGYLADGAPIGAKEAPKLPFEDLGDIPQNLKSDSIDTPLFSDVRSTDAISSQETQHISHQEVLNTASDLVLNTIETAVKHVSSSNSIVELSSTVQECFVSHNPFEKQDQDIVNSSPVSSGLTPLSVKGPHQLNPNAEPFVMKKDFPPFNPGTLISSSPMHFARTEDLILLKISSSPVSLSEVLVDDNIAPVAVQGDASGDTVMVNSSGISSPLPSAPPLEALSEGQMLFASGECPAQIDMIPSANNNPFFSSVESGGMENKIPAAFAEVSSTVEDLSQPPHIVEFGSQPSVLQVESKPPSQELDQLYSLRDQVLLENSKLTDLLSPQSIQEPEAQPSPPVVEPEEAQPEAQASPVLEPESQPTPIPPSIQEPKSQPPPPVQEPEAQPSPAVQEPEAQPSPAVQEPEAQPSPAVQEPEAQPSPAVQEPEAQPSPAVQEPGAQPSAVQEPEAQPSPAVQEPEAQPSPAVQEPGAQPSPGAQPFPSVQEPLAQPPVQLEEKELKVHQLAAGDSLNIQQFMDQPPTLPGLCPSNKEILLDHSDLININESSSQLSDVRDSVSELSIMDLKDNYENKIILATESMEIQDSSSLNQIIMSEESSILESSVDQSKDVAQDSQLQDIAGDLTGNDSVKDESPIEDVSKQVTQQVIGKDSLLPKEVQAKLLEVTSTTLPTESVTEDAPVDLKAIPDGFPEAEGVTEDMDSDSEKDGGWSYVKANSSSLEKKASKKVAEAGKVTNKKDVAASKDRKVPTKTFGDTRSKLKGNISGTADAGKKIAPEKADRKVLETKDKDRPTAVSKTTSAQPVASKTLISERKLIKKTATTATRIVPSKPSATSTTGTTKQPASVGSKTTASLASKPQTGVPEKVLGKPMHSSTPFRPNLQKSSPVAGTTKPLIRPASATASSSPVAGTTKPLIRPASATASHSNVISSVNATKPSSSSYKPQPRAASAPLATKTLPSTKVNATGGKSNASAPLSAEVKPKSSGTVFRKPLPPPAKKQDVKETKDSTNKQILAKKTTQVSTSTAAATTTTTTTQVRRTGASASVVKVDSVSKKSGSTIMSDTTKTSKMSAARTGVTKTSMISKTATARGRVPKQSSKPVKPESDRKPSEAKQSKNGPKKIVSDTSSSDQKCSPDNRMQEMNEEKGMLEVNARETADDKLAGAGINPLINVPTSEIVSKSELKQESNVIECPVSVTPSEEEKV